MQKTIKQRIICGFLTIFWCIGILPQSGLEAYSRFFAFAEETQETVETEDEDEEIITIADLARLDDSPYAGSAMETDTDSFELEQVDLADEDGTNESSTESKTDDNNGDEDETAEDASNQLAWSYTMHYVGEDNYYNVTKTDDFSLKYQFEFHSEGGTIESGKAVIRINANILYNETTKAYIEPSDIGVPEFAKNDDGRYTCINSEGAYNITGGQMDGSSYIATSPFNYYYETGDDGNQYIVFVNYREVPAGTNVAIQVLYDDLKAFDYNDMDTWNIQADVKVNEETLKPTPLTGLLDTAVQITGVTKDEYKEAKVSYTPGLYTPSQIKKFTQADVPGQYLDGENLNSNYVYTVFKVNITGTCNQRFKLSMQDIFPTAFQESGSIVGIAIGSDYRNAKAITQSDDGTWSLGDYQVTNNSAEWGAITGVNGKSVYDGEAFSATCWVVAAYEKSKIPSDYTKTGTDANGKTYTYYDLLNSVTVTITPEDGTDSSSSSSSSSSSADENGNAKTTWEPYFWDYYGDKGGDEFTETSKSRNCSQDLKGWFEGFNAEEGEAYDAGIGFTVSGEVQTYAATHQNLTDNSAYDKYTGGWVHTIFADDVLYATETNGTTTSNKELTGNDYYIDGGTINMRDIGVDVYNDETCAPTSDEALAANIQALIEASTTTNLGYEKVDRKWYIYGLVQKSDGTNTWEEIQTVDFNTIAWNNTDMKMRLRSAVQQ